MNVGTQNSKPAEVNGTKTKSLRCRRTKCLIYSKRAEQGKGLDSQFVYIGVFSDDFAAVDLREVLCYHSRPKRQNSECISERKLAKKKAPIIVGACSYGSGEVYLYFVVIQNDLFYEQAYECLRFFFERPFIVFPCL